MTPVTVPGPQGTSLLCEGKHSSLTITTLAQALGPALATVLAHAPKHALYLHKHLTSMHPAFYYTAFATCTHTLIHSFCFNRALAFIEAALKTKCEI